MPAGTHGGCPSRRLVVAVHRQPGRFAAYGAPVQYALLAGLGDALRISGVKFGSRARKAGFDQGYDVVSVAVPSGRPSAHWFYVPAFALIAFVWWAQGRRMRPEPVAHAHA